MPNQAPVFTAVGAAITYNENSPPVPIVTDVEVSDSDSDHYAGGVLTFSITSGAVAGDLLSLSTSSEPGRGVELNGGNILFNGVVVGTLTSTGVTLSIALNSFATDAAVAALAEAVRISSTSDHPTAAEREVTFTLNDGGGNADGGQNITSFTRSVSFQPSNDAPTLTGFEEAVTFGEQAANGDLQLIDPDVEFGDAEGNFTGGTLVLAGGLAADTLGILNQGDGENQISVSGSEISFGGVLIGTFSGGDGTTPLTVTLNAAATSATIDALIQRLGFGTASENPAEARTLTLMITDAAGASVSQNLVVNVTAQNDAPTLADLEEAVTFGEQAANGGLQLIDADVEFGDAEGNFTGGTLVVTGGLAGDVLGILHQGTGENQISISGAEISFGSVLIGTFSGGDGTSALTVTLNAAATSAAVDALIQRLGFATGSDTPGPARTLTLTVTDAAGAAVSQDLTVNVTAQNDAPALTAPSSSALMFAENGAAVALMQGVTLSDPDLPGDFAGGSISLTVEGIGGGISLRTGSAFQIIGGPDGTTRLTVSITNEDGSTTQVEIASISGIGTTNLQIQDLTDSATLLRVNDLLDEFVYTDSSENPGGGERVVTLTFHDGGISDGSAASAQRTQTLTVTPINDAPTLVAPTTYSATEQVALSLNGSISVADVDASAGIVIATLSVAYGVLDVSLGNSGVTLVSGGNGSSSVTFSGTLSQVNSLLGTASGSTVTYTANTNAPPGSTTLTLSINDGGNSGTGAEQTTTISRAINIQRVNDAPSIDHLGGDVTLFVEGQNGVRIDLGGNALVRDSDALDFEIVRVANGFSQPVFAQMLADGSGRILIVQKAGLIQVLNPDGSIGTPFLDLRGQVGTAIEDGMSSIALAPDFATSGTFYVFFTGLTGDNEVWRYQTVDGDLARADPASADRILVIPSPNSNIHNAGWMGFGPDGMLYITTGDAGPDSNGQSINDLSGGVLRIDVSADAFPDDPDRDYSIPSDNPFAGAIPGQDEIWAYGMRNPFRASFDPLTGDLYLGDVGQEGREEINIIPAGRGGLNFGWSSLEGTLPYGTPSTADLTPPVLEYGRTGPFGGRSVTGGIVYRGPIQSLDGEYIFADAITTRLWHLTASTMVPGRTLPGESLTPIVDIRPNAGALNLITSFLVEPGGSILITDLDGEVFRVQPAETNFARGQLRVTITENRVLTEDMIGFDLGGPVSLSNGLSANSQVLVNGVVVGTIALNGTGSGANGLIVQLNSAATATAISTLMQYISYTNTNHNDPSAAPRTLQVSLLDGAGAQLGGQDRVIATTTVHVAAVNDAPVNSVPQAQFMNEDTTITFSSARGNAITVFDVDSRGGNLRVDVSVTDGILNVGDVAGVTVTGRDTTNLVLTGSVSAINAALDGLTYTPRFNVEGVRTLTIRTIETSASGLGLRDTDTVTININPVEEIFDQPIAFIASPFGRISGGWSSQDEFPRSVADINGDGRMDIVGFGAAGVYASLGLSNGRFGDVFLVSNSFGRTPDAGGWASQDRFPRVLADVDGDGRMDIVGFGSQGTYVALATGGGFFGPLRLATPEFGSSVVAGGWASQNLHSRHLADVNGDGRADIVAFGDAGTYVALATPDGTFGEAQLVNFDFGRTIGAGGWSSQAAYPRMLADVNGDGRADIVGFGEAGIYVALASGSGGFGPMTLTNQTFATAQRAGGWGSNDRYPRMMADINGDGLADVIGFGEGHTFYSLANGQGGFGAVQIALSAFGASTGAGGWASWNQLPRTLADLNGDGLADIIGFGENGLSVALADFAAAPSAEAEPLASLGERGAELTDEALLDLFPRAGDGEPFLPFEEPEGGALGGLSPASGGGMMPVFLRPVGAEDAAFHLNEFGGELHMLVPPTSEDLTGGGAFVV